MTINIPEAPQETQIYVTARDEGGSPIIGADVYLQDTPNQIWIGQTPLLYDIAPGAHQIGIYKKYYYLWGMSFMVNEGQTLPIEAVMTFIQAPFDQDLISGASHDIFGCRCQPGVDFSWTNEDKINAFVFTGAPWQPRYPEQRIEYNDYAVNNEAIAVLLNLFDFGADYTTNVNFRWYRLSDGEKVIEWDTTLGPASAQGYEYWSWWSIVSWIGKCGWEIREVGVYQCVITVNGGPIHGNAKIYFEVV